MSPMHHQAAFLAMPQADRIKLHDYQEKALRQLKTGSVLCGGVGSGKTITSIGYFYIKELGGSFDKFGNLGPVSKKKDLIVITTAKKRDTLDWEREAAFFGISKDKTISGIGLTVDSWNNIKKYIGIKDSFFIFDEQRVIGSGSWVKSFLKITKNNNWILLSATPGDTWIDYVPVFIANGFYKNKTDFVLKHVVYNTFTKFPKIDRYTGENHLRKLKDSILVYMPYERPTTSYYKFVDVSYDLDLFNQAYKKRWNPYKNRPIKEVGEYCYILRRIVNSDISRINFIRLLLNQHKKIIVFYNFNYELDLLKNIELDGVSIAEYNGHKHQEIPNTQSWLYLVQYLSGSEGWNCIETNAMIFFSQNYSYRIMTQAAGRIDRQNTPFTKLYYYVFKSDSPIDRAIGKALEQKQNFNERHFERSQDGYIL